MLLVTTSSSPEHGSKLLTSVVVVMCESGLLQTVPTLFLQKRHKQRHRVYTQPKHT